MGKYNFELCLNENNSLKIIIDRIKSGSTVLEFGPAEGRLTKYLSENLECKVTVIELDSEAFESARQFAVDGLCTDIETFEWTDYLKGQKFDYILFPDVLEHLKHPEQVLEKTTDFLKNDGSVIFSIPNLAHNKVLVKLYYNHVDYTDVGLLDNTHIKFWGYENLNKFSVDAGYQIVFEDMTYDDNWNGDQAVDKSKLDSKLLDSIGKRKLGNAYQFILELKKTEYCEQHCIRKEQGKFIARGQGRQVNIFYDYGNGYSEETRQCIYANPISNTQIYNVEIPIEGKVKQIRFDPTEDNYVLVRILSCVDEKGNTCEIKALNGVSSHNMEIFNTKTPQYECTVYNQKMLIISYLVNEVPMEEMNQIQELLRISNASLEENVFLKERNGQFENELKNKEQLLMEQTKKIKLLEKASDLRNDIIRVINKDSAIKEVVREVTVPDLNSQMLAADYKDRLEQIENSTFWKLTKPAREGTDGIKNAYRRFSDRKLRSKRITEDMKPRIAVHVHLYYEDLLEEFCEYLNNITEPFDLFISCKKGADVSRIKEIAKSIKKVQRVVTKETQNRGRDIAPFYVLFREELSQYECLLHVHSKKSLYTGEEKAEWRHWALDGVLKSEDAVAHMLYLLLEADQKAGLIYGELTPTLPMMAYHWLKNEQKGREILQKMNIPFEEGMFCYPAGSFFWARTEAIKPLFDLKLTYEDFDEEHGQIDGTLAHALERVVAFVSKNQGFDSYIFDAERNHFSRNIGYRAYEGYFGYNVDNVSKLLKQFDLISFDIFDTLITRLVYRPDDVFRLMNRVIEKKYQKKFDFLSLRKSAEEAAWKRKGDYCNIHDIYQAMADQSEFTKEQISELKQLEIDLEYKLCIPRKDAKRVFDKLIRAGKRVILVSDMYLTKELIEKILKKCGYQGYEDIWVSCEMGLRKDRDTMWERFFNEFKELRTIHVGDNAHSDCQLVGDRQRANMLWLSGREEFKISPYYQELKRFADTSEENAVMLGYLINGCMFNSPFAVEGNGRIRVKELKEAAQGFFAPVFTVFAQCIAKLDMDQLLFLSREGYFLQRLYKVYCESFGVEEITNEYFLTSRRAVSVPQIRGVEDICDLLNKAYHGSMKNLLEERFGVMDPQLMEDADGTVKLPEQKKLALEAISYNAEKLIHEADMERTVYKEYVSSLTKGFDDHKIALVDVGYAGSIQCYLMKLMKKKYSGFYLATEYDIKPEALGGICDSVYTFAENKTFEFTQLFLEAVTAAPHGQVIYMKKDNGEFVPVLKHEKEACWQAAEKMQQEIIQYVKEMGDLLKEINPLFSSELAEKILGLALQEGIFGEELENMFTVHDGYCMGNGEWRFDTNRGKWVLK